MAIENLAALSDALGQALAPTLYHQWNREAVTLSQIPVRPGRGKNAAWDAEFSGDVDAVDVAEGSDVGSGEFDSDEDVPAILPWAYYRKAFQISEQALDAAATSRGITADDLVDLFGERVTGAAARLISKMNYDAINGTGTGTGGNQSIVGLVTAVDSTGTYATILRSSRAEWAAQEFANGGTPRPLSLTLLAAAERALFDACGMPPTRIRTGPGVWNRYENLFNEVRRLSTDGMGPLTYQAGASNLFWRGIPIVRDKDFPAGTLIMENDAYLEAQFLPRMGTPRDTVMEQMRTLQGLTGQPGKAPTATAIPFRFFVLGKTGESIKCALACRLQLCVKRPNAFAKIVDIAES